MRTVCCQPANLYYAWQTEVMIDNFLGVGLDPQMIDIVCLITDKVPDEWLRLQQRYPVRFFFYQDTRPEYVYPPSAYFHALKKHLKTRSDLGEVLFLHDCDILFTRKPDFSEMEKGSEWYLSDTNSYINYDYVVSKGEEQFLDLCKIVGIDPEEVKKRNLHSGGAQYLVKGLTYELVEKTESDSLKLYRYMCEKEPLWKGEGYPIQKWTAGMWSFLWNAWLFGHETIVDKRLDFGWVTNLKTDLEKVILHNAGVTATGQGLLYKQDYQFRLPYGDNLQIDETKAGHWYWEQVQRVGKTSVL